MENGNTFYFSADIENSLVSILWRQPEYLPDFLRQCDPAVHLVQTHCQIIAEAINLVDTRVGGTDFASVVQAVREMGRFDECGGLEGLNSVYSSHEPTKYTPAVFAHYVEAIKAYAENRVGDTPRGTTLYTGGIGSARIEKRRGRAIGLDYAGEARIRGRYYKCRIEVPDHGQSLDLKFDPIR